MAEGAPVVETTDGKLEGRWEGAVAAFRGVRYASPPVGARRWAPPSPPEPWEGVRPAHACGPIAPQGPAPLQPATGPLNGGPVGEDCLTLNVWTPAPGTAEQLPVLVYIHGGGYLSGAGSSPWYDGARMARRGPAVVVTINYRLGALGFLRLPSSVTGGEPIENLAVLDQCLALEWVAANVERFGGDPSRVTLFGQSVGAHAIACLASIPRAAPLFQRAILQSGPLGSHAHTPQHAERTSETFRTALGMADATLDELRAVPVPQLLAAQGATLMQSLVFGELDPPFQPVVDGTLLAAEPLGNAARHLAGVDLMVGYTSHEARAFFFNEALWGLSVWDHSAAELAEEACRRGNERLAKRLPVYVAHGEDGRPGAAAFCDIPSDDFMIADTVELAAARAANGRPAYLYEVAWAPDGADGKLGACHAIDLPLVFGNLDAWEQARMLGERPAEEARELSDRVQDAWLAFAADGSPQHPGLPEWTPCEGDELRVMRLDADECAITGEPAGGRRKLWRRAAHV